MIFIEIIIILRWFVFFQLDRFQCQYWKLLHYPKCWKVSNVQEYFRQWSFLPLGQCVGVVGVFLMILRHYSIVFEFCGKFMGFWLFLYKISDFMGTSRKNNGILSKNHQKSPKSRFWWKSTYFWFSKHHKIMIICNRNYEFRSTMYIENFRLRWTPFREIP